MTSDVDDEYLMFLISWSWLVEDLVNLMDRTCSE